MKNLIIAPKLFLILLILGSNTSCFDALNLEPRYGINSTSVYSEPKNYYNVLAKLYGGYSLTGQNGPAGNPDVTIGRDEGFSQYLRCHWNMQELPTEEAVCAWTDPGIPELNTGEWNSQNSFVNMMYSRIFFQVAICNEFIYYCSEDWMSEKGFSETDKAKIRTYKAEARFLRALSYYHAIDLFGNVPLVTEEQRPGSGIPIQSNRSQLFNYVETELKEIENQLLSPRTNEYGRADRAAAWALLSRLYLNANVYINQPKYTECISYCNKIINAGYTLEENYEYLFRADNHRCSNEIIFAINFDGLRSKTWGGTTFLLSSSIGTTGTDTAFQSYVLRKRGFPSGWNGNRATPRVWSWYDTSDTRRLIDTFGNRPAMSLVIDTITDSKLFNKGVIVRKFCNITQNGGFGNDGSRTHADIDWPIFRLADVYLMYIESVIRGGNGGSNSDALTYYQNIQRRAFKNNVSPVALPSLDDLLLERGRELLWESVRRTDLIRFDKFTTGTYTWEFKGGQKDGAALPDHLNLYPLPISDLIANPNLVQNQGYSR